MKNILICSILFFTTAAIAAPYGTFHNPVEDPPFTGDWSRPVHRGMYCVKGTWHHGWLQPWETSPVVKPSCGTAIYQIED